jgi:hypothetical protein
MREKTVNNLHEPAAVLLKCHYSLPVKTSGTELEKPDSEKTNVMKQPFEIKFDFPVAHSDLIISLRATAELHHSDPYYVVDGFYFASQNGKQHLSLLPAQEIKQIKKGHVHTWVHKDSGRESLLSLAIGKAIEKTF